MCGRQNKRMAPHHILPKRDYPQYMYRVSNGITLCWRCHRKTFGQEYQFVSIFRAALNRKGLVMAKAMAAKKGAATKAKAPAKKAPAKKKMNDAKMKKKKGSC